jgi:type I restriction enzyme S subunit
MIDAALPSGWRSTPLSDLLIEEDVRAGKEDRESFEVLSLTKRFGLVPQSERFNKRVATEDTSNYKVVRQGWIAYNPYVIWEGAIHALRRAIPGVVSPAYLVWRRREDDYGYLDYVLRSPALIRTYESLSAGAVNRRRSISKSDFLGIEVRCPPLPEQRRIAALLNTIQQAVAQQERLAAIASELKRALLATCFTIGLRHEPLTDTVLGPRPASWRISPIGSIARLSSGGTPSRTKPEYWDEGVIPWVKTGEVDNAVIGKVEEYITEAGLKNSSAKLFPVGTLLMAMYGQGVTRGKVALLGIEATTNQASVAFFPNGEVSAEYLYYLFQSRYEEIRAHGHGANQPNLSAEIIKGIKITYPTDPDEQREVVDVLKLVDARVDQARRARATLETLFVSVLQETMTGKLRVSEDAARKLEARFQPPDEL